ncbi:hypothetical protein [Paenibacillus aquistagni]|uniref:hypothetical protein n=1 Tax=Paenibacillus aquistagni TaxID=1852522 RepID=UPI000B5135BA|nr:hypothetical protein [Paenibacillus aquistagni]
MKTVFAACSLALLLMTSCTPNQEEDEQSAAAVRSPYAQSSSGALAAIKQPIPHQEGIEERDWSYLREALNLSFKMFAAMNEKDGAYIQAISSSNVEVNTSKHTISFPYGDRTVETPFLQNVSLQTLEFRALTYADDHAVELAFANRQDETMVEIHAQFIREFGVWKLDGVITN